MARFPFALPARATGLLVIGLLNAGTASAQSDINCALIEDGIQRLACYDARQDPAAARQQASEAELEQAEDRAGALAADDEARAEIVGNALEDDPDTGVMANLVDNYLEAERAIFSFSGSFVTHRPNYILPITWQDDPNTSP
ncbi:MAG: phospholipase, partial [Marinobacter sp. 34-60-7]